MRKLSLTHITHYEVKCNTTILSGRKFNSHEVVEKKFVHLAIISMAPQPRKILKADGHAFNRLMAVSNPAISFA